MTEKYEKRKDSNKRYLEKLDQVTFRVPKGGKKELQQLVKDVGYPSVNQFIVDAVESYKKVVLSDIEAGSDTF